MTHRFNPGAEWRLHNLKRQEEMKMIHTAVGHVACLNIGQINNELGVIYSRQFIEQTLGVKPVHEEGRGVYWRVEDMAKIKMAHAVRLLDGCLQAKQKICATIDYTNHKGRRATRTITPLELLFGGTEFHPESQWLLRAYDHDKNAERTFALAGVHEWRLGAVV